MTRLAHSIAATGRAGDSPLIITPGRALACGAALEARASGDARRAGRLALHIADPALLLEALIALDGDVAALLLLSHAVAPDIAAALAAQAECAAIVTDMPEAAAALAAWSGAVLTPAAAIDATGGRDRGGDAPAATEWLMTTSGTTGLPKIVPHTLASLARTVRASEADPPPRWGMLYDPTRFAGAQVLLQAVCGGGALIAPDTDAPLADQIAFLAAHRVDHMSATPTLWRRLLMAPDCRDLPLRQATLGGEIVDQGVLDALKAAFPAARITHIYASTEAGVGFAVNDGLAGFPTRFFEKAPGGVRLKAVDDLLWLRAEDGRRPERQTARVDADGFICSEDRLQIEGDRAYFLGRDNGSINVGGVKVFPETVERVILEDARIRMAKVTAKASPIMGAVLVAEVVIDADADRAAAKRDIQQRCRASLDRAATPAVIRFVDDFNVNAAGKIVRKTGS